MNFTPTDHAPGTVEKLELLKFRAAHGLPLFHPCDRVDCNGLCGGVITTTRGRREARPGKQATKLAMGLRKTLSE